MKWPVKGLADARSSLEPLIRRSSTFFPEYFCFGGTFVPSHHQIVPGQLLTVFYALFSFLKTSLVFTRRDSTSATRGNEKHRVITLVVVLFSFKSRHVLLPSTTLCPQATLLDKNSWYCPLYDIDRRGTHSLAFANVHLKALCAFSPLVRTKEKLKIRAESKYRWVFCCSGFMTRKKTNKQKKTLWYIHIVLSIVCHKALGVGPRCWCHRQSRFHLVIKVRNQNMVKELQQGTVKSRVQWTDHDPDNRMTKWTQNTGKSTRRTPGWRHTMEHNKLAEKEENTRT